MVRFNAQGSELPAAPLAPTPAWLHPAEKILREATSRVRMIAATTPVDLAGELERLFVSWNAGEPRSPRFEFPQRQDHRDLIVALERLAEHLEAEGPLGNAYADRARELAIEAAICSAVGAPQFRACARRRFSRRDTFDDAADRLAMDWLDEPLIDATLDAAEFVLSDDEREPRSLLVRLRTELGRRKLPFRVVVARDSSALAATGDSFVQVAKNRKMTLADVERTVLHEIEGHVLPRWRANAQSLGLFALGTRFGVDDQEGRALCIEQRAGHLTIFRRRELAFRHIAARRAEHGAEFVDVVPILLERGATLTDALRITARVFRGGGLARELVYLPAFLRVESALRASPDIDGVVGAGRVSIQAADVLRGHVQEKH